MRGNEGVHKGDFIQFNFCDYFEMPVFRIKRIFIKGLKLSNIISRKMIISQFFDSIFFNVILN